MAGRSGTRHAGAHTSVRSRVIGAVAAGILLGCVMAWLYPHGLFGPDPDVVRRAASKSDVQRITLMAWLVIVLAVVLCWVASICKIYFSPQSSEKATFLSNGVKKKNILLVIAHPDDESMFFSPTINYLASMGHNLHVLCVSTGDADGMGSVRKEELYKACAILKVTLNQVKVLDDPNLQDGFWRVWDHNHLAKIIEEEVASGNIDSIITFDEYGISGHCNHKDVHHGVRKYLNLSTGKTEAWELVSTNILRKYSGPVDIWLSIIYPMCCRSGQVHCLLNESPSKSFQAMSQHMSQWVWFRKLFVSFSSYTYVNTINRIN